MKHHNEMQGVELKLSHFYAFHTACYSYPKYITVSVLCF